jgi:hypothetical protein
MSNSSSCIVSVWAQTTHDDSRRQSNFPAVCSKVIYHLHAMSLLVKNMYCCLPLLSDKLLEYFLPKVWTEDKLVKKNFRCRHRLLEFSTHVNTI